MKDDPRLLDCEFVGQVQIPFLERFCDQLDVVASAQSEDRFIAMNLINLLYKQEQTGENMICCLATALLIVVEQQVAAQKACIYKVPSIFTEAFNQP